VSVCVCLSQVGVLLKRLNVRSHRQHHTIAQDSSFLNPKISAKFDRSHPPRGRQMLVGWVKIGDFWQPAICRKWYKIDACRVRSRTRSIEWWRYRWPWLILSAPNYPNLYILRRFSYVRVQLESSNLVCRLTVASPSLPMKNIPSKWRGQDHATF